MLTLTYSSIDTFQRCPRLYHFRYELLKDSGTTEAMTFGSAVHSALEAIWGGSAPPPSDDPVINKIVALYTEAVEIPAGAKPEQQFLERVKGMRGVRIAGKVDVVLPHAIVEHKTTAYKIGPGDPYWAKLSNDGQVSLYLWATGRRECLYDVIRKPAIRQRKDEPDAEFRQRQADSMTAENLACAPTYRRDSQIDAHMEDVKTTIRAVRRKERPCHPHACFDYNRACAFHAVCSGEASIEDFATKETAHTELEGI